MTYVPCKKNDQNGYIFYIGLVSQANTKIFQDNPTLADGDIKVSIDGNTPANITTLPEVVTSLTKLVKVTLSQDETNGDNIAILFSDAAGNEWCDLSICIQTVDVQFNDIQTQTYELG